ncbi:cryptochrome/photolyase family protein [Portibacter lacus]|uniref:Cryptochrome/photolyase family protein n=2 Tax=Portibacter lacus TaxID=1099794 RepID=A0AA37SKK4_9BACT|nr:cryptochrome/photolyase family protein [Portibacter lacus]
MKAYAKFLEDRNIEVEYIDAQSKKSDIRNLIPSLAKDGIKQIRFIDPTDDYLRQRIIEKAKAEEIELIEEKSGLFMNTLEEIQAYFKPERKKFNQGQFYIQQRKKLDILMDPAGEPIGGKWSFDDQNRKKYPKGKEAPEIRFPANNDFYEEAVSYVEKYYSSNPGRLTENPLYAIDPSSAEAWFDQFLKERFKEFGAYEDALMTKEAILNHSVLSPLINVGLLNPKTVVETAVDFAQKNDVPINSVEGFVRQIIGWREFIRGIYEVKGREERTKNFWGFKRKIPASFYDGTTGIDPIDIVIRKVVDTGYCHHIERLMVLGNFMILCEFDPDEVYRWFMELFIDAYDWVMVPNIYGMSQFADGGIFATKPYISGSNYLKKMSDYKNGDWQEVWDSLFWRFMNVHRDFFQQNPRLSMLLSTYDRFDREKQTKLMDRAEEYLKTLD